MAKQFHISDILSVSTGSLLSNRHMDGMYDILGYLTGEELYTHQLPRAMRDVKPWLMAQHPGLPTADDAKHVNEHNYKSFVADWQEKFGEWLSIEPMPAGENGPRDPIQELVEMVGKDRVMVVGIDSTTTETER